MSTTKTLEEREADFRRQVLEEFGINEIGEAPIHHVEHFKGKSWALRRMKLDDLEIVNNLLIEEKMSRISGATPEPKEGEKSPEEKKGTVEDETFEPEYIIDLKVQMAFVAAFLAAIGKDQEPLNLVPTWSLFKTASEEELEGHHPLDPPHDVKVKTAKCLYNYFKGSRKLGVIGHLYMVYNQKFEEKKKGAGTPEGKEGEVETPDEVTGDPSDRPTHEP